MKFVLLNGIRYIKSIHDCANIRKMGRKISNVWAYDRVFNRRRTITNQSKNNKFSRYYVKSERNFYRLHKRSYSNTTLDHISYKSENNQEELQI